MKTKKSYYTFILLFIGIVLLVNFISVDYFMRFDLTDNKRFTLSEATEDVIKELLEPVTVKAYFSENLPPNVAQIREDFKNLLIEYSSLSDGNLVYEFIHPNKDETTEQEATQAGISPVMINVRNKDQMQQQKAFMGAVIQMGERQHVIPFMQPGEAMEYALTTSIKKLSIVKKPVVGLLQGHDEPSTSDMQQVSQELSILYDFEDLIFNDSTQIEDRFKTIAIVSPKDTLQPDHLRQLDAFLERGGRLLVALDKVDADLQGGYGSEVYTGLEGWLTKKGITVENKFLLDSKCGSITLQQRQGHFTMQSQVRFPFLPILNEFADHPITKGLESVMLPFASPLKFTGDTTINFIPLAFSSAKSATSSVPTYFDVQKQWTDNDFPLEKQVVIAALEDNLHNAKIVVMGDGGFAINSRDGKNPQNVQPDNVSLFVNSIDWLSDDTGLIELRTKGISSRPLDELEEGTKFTLKALNFALPIILAIIYGIVRVQIRRTKRIKRMEVSYE